MSLHVYINRKEIPKGMIVVDDNDVFFNGHTILNNSDFEKEVLRKIDKATYRSPRSFNGRSNLFGDLDRNLLSTGTKTLLNIEKNEGVCFNTIECGMNALSMIRNIKSGNILIEHRCILYYEDDEDCDIIFEGKRYLNFYDFLDALMNF